jgi:hypothetical protein
MPAMGRWSGDFVAWLYLMTRYNLLFEHTSLNCHSFVANYPCFQGGLECVEQRGRQREPAAYRNADFIRLGAKLV